MATVGRIVVDVDADTAKFVKGLNKSIRKTEDWGSKIRRAATHAVKRFVQVTTAAVVAIGAMTLRGVQMGDQLVKTASKLGVAATALEGLRFAAQQTGVEARQLDMGIQRMTRRIAEAAQGTGEAKEAIKTLGLDARTLVNLPLEQQFFAIADAMEAVENPAERVRLGFKLFDSEGVALINTLGAGREELQGFMEEAKRLGLFLTGTQQRVVAETSDEIGRLQSAFKGLSMQLGATFGPAIQYGAEAITNFLARITGSLPKLAAFAAGILGIERALNNLTLRDVEAEMDRLTRGMVENMERITRLRERLASGESKDPQTVQRTLNALLAEEAQVRERLNELAERRSELQRTGDKPTVKSGNVPQINDGLNQIEVRIQRIEPMLNLPPLKLPTSDAKKNLEELAGTMRSSLLDSAQNAMLGIETGFDEMLKRMVARVAATQIFNALGSLGGPVGSFFGNFLGFGGVPKAQHGMEFTVGGRGGTDKNLIPIMASRGENVKITPRGQGSDGVVLNQTNNIDARGADASVLPRLQALLESNKQQTKAEVQQLIRRRRFA